LVINHHFDLGRTDLTYAINGLAKLRIIDSRKQLRLGYTTTADHSLSLMRVKKYYLTWAPY
jgi:hypothetical protein